jgi:hypothetical protein
VPPSREEPRRYRAVVGFRTLEIIPLIGINDEIVGGDGDDVPSYALLEPQDVQADRELRGLVVMTVQQARRAVQAEQAPRGGGAGSAARKSSSSRA